MEQPGVQAASPVVEAMAAALEADDEPIRFMGIDPFLDAKFRNLGPAGSEDTSFTEFLVGREPSAFLSGKLMDAYGLKPGSSLTVS